MSVVVLGSFVQDLAFKTECFPAPGETRIGTFLPGAGGKGFNQAVACARQGVDTLFIGAVGKDSFSSTLHEFVAAQDFLRTKLLEVDHAQTGAAAIVVDEQGQNMIVVALGANNELCPSFVGDCENLLENASLVVCQLESNVEGTAAALQIARSHGVRTLLNPAPINKSVTKELLSLVDILIPNETEFAFLLKHLVGLELEDDPWRIPPEKMSELCSLLEVPMVVVTLGEHVAFVSSRLEPGYFVAPRQVDAIDTTGAGDAFVGGLSAGLVLYGDSMQEATEYATSVAALSVCKQGTAPAMPCRDEVRQLLRQ